CRVGAFFLPLWFSRIGGSGSGRSGRRSGGRIGRRGDGLPSFLSRLLPVCLSHLGGRVGGVIPVLFSRFVDGGRIGGSDWILPGGTLPPPLSHHFLPVSFFHGSGRGRQALLFSRRCGSGRGLPVLSHPPAVECLPGEDRLRHDQGGGSRQPEQDTGDTVLPPGGDVGPAHQRHSQQPAKYGGSRSEEHTSEP